MAAVKAYFMKDLNPPYSNTKKCLTRLHGTWLTSRVIMERTLLRYSESNCNLVRSPLIAS